jgi:hypothetical protein
MEMCNRGIFGDLRDGVDGGINWIWLILDSERSTSLGFHRTFYGLEGSSKCRSSFRNNLSPTQAPKKTLPKKPSTDKQPKKQ